MDFGSESFVFDEIAIPLQPQKNDFFNQKNSKSMGKGDKRTKRGKIFQGSHGNSRPKAVKATTAPKSTATDPKSA